MTKAVRWFSSLSSNLRRRGLLPESARSILKYSRIVRDRVSRKFGVTKYSYPALYSIDQNLLPILPSKGVFLEIGANDGYNQSNTYHLEAVRGWRGILIEPVPRLFRACVRARAKSQCFNLACVAADAESEVEIIDSDLTSSVDFARMAPSTRRTHKVGAVTLSKIIDSSSFTHIDFMSIDVEGGELRVLDGLDLERHCPDFLLVETDVPLRIDEVLSPYMVRHQQLTFHDYLWVRS